MSAPAASESESASESGNRHDPAPEVRQPTRLVWERAERRVEALGADTTVMYTTDVARGFHAMGDRLVRTTVLTSSTATPATSVSTSIVYVPDTKYPVLYPAP